MKAKRKLRVNDLVRVVDTEGKLSDTLYTLSWLGEGPYRTRCCIREAGNPLAGDREFDTSLLRRDDPIPGVLRRTPLTPEAKAILAEQADRTRTKSRARIAKMKAKQNGDTKRMPLTGRAAIEAIRG